MERTRQFLKRSWDFVGEGALAQITELPLVQDEPPFLGFSLLGNCKQPLSGRGVAVRVTRTRLESQHRVGIWLKQPQHSLTWTLSVTDLAFWHHSSRWTAPQRVKAG